MFTWEQRDIIAYILNWVDAKTFYALLLSNKLISSICQSQVGAKRKQYLVTKKERKKRFGSVRIEVDITFTELPNGQIEGLYEETHENKLLIRCQYINGVKHGLCQKWWKSRLTYQCNYVDGKEHGIRQTWYWTGELESRIIMDYGEPKGIVHFWHRNGSLKSLSDHDQSFRLYQSWYYHGSQRKQCTFRDGEYHGLLTIWNQYGNVKRQEHYVEGVEV